MGTLRDSLSTATACGIRDELHRCLLQNDWNKMKDLVADDVQLVFPHLGINQKHDGFDWLKKMFGKFHEAFPDAEYAVRDESIKGNRIWSEITWQGTHLGKIGSVEPTKRKIKDRPFVEIMDIQDGKVTAIKQFQDGNSLYVELGVSPMTVPPFLSVDSEEVEKLRKSICGTVITPNSPSYPSQVMMANGDIISKPAVMIQCIGASDIIKAIEFCKDFRQKNPEAPRAVIRAGGHSWSGVSTNIGGCVIDLRKMRSVVVDEKEQTCWVDGGALAQDVDREIFARGGFVMTTGQVSNTGIGGLASGGGFGLLTHRLGLMIDSLLELEFVLADGRIVTCSKTNNPELFWAAKGGARWLGVVTRFKFKITKLGKPTSNAIMVFDVQHYAKCFSATRKLVQRDSFGLIAIAPSPMEPGKAVVMIHLTVLDDLEHAKQVRELFLREVGVEPMAELLPLSERPWPQINSAVDFIWPYGVREYVKPYELGNDEATCLKFIEKFVAMRPPNAALALDWNCGAYCKPSGDDAGLLHCRDPVYVGPVMLALDCEGATTEQARQFCREFLEATKELRHEHPQYVNFGEEHLLEARTSKDVANRFRRVKQEVDPDAFFGKVF